MYPTQPCKGEREGYTRNLCSNRCVLKFPGKKQGAEPGREKTNGTQSFFAVSWQSAAIWKMWAGPLSSARGGPGRASGTPKTRGRWEPQTVAVFQRSAVVLESVQRQLLLAFDRRLSGSDSTLFSTSLAGPASVEGPVVLGSNLLPIAPVSASQCEKAEWIEPLCPAAVAL